MADKASATARLIRRLAVLLVGGACIYLSKRCYSLTPYLWQLGFLIRFILDVL